MKKIVLIALVMTCFACKNKKDQVSSEMKKETEIVQNSKWVTLFDGKSLDNWRGYGAETIHPQWSIEGETLAFTPGGEGNKDIISKNEYRNFMLSLEWKISKNGNSGIFYGVHEDEKFPEAYYTGPEIQVLDNIGHPDSKVANGTHTAGSLYDMIACPTDIIKPAGEWNWVVLEVNHDTNLGKVRMNGKEVITFPVHGEEWDNMVANSKFKAWSDFGKYSTGHIALQDHGNKVWYKNIKIKEL